MSVTETNSAVDVKGEIPEAQGAYSAEELRYAARVADKLVLVVKNISFYPDNHAIARKSVSEAYDTLVAFLDHYGSFVLGVEKSHFHYRGKDISRKSGIHQDLAYKCYRDGIQYLVFSETMTQDEFNAFVRIVSRRSLMEETAEGDIVTDMWEARLRGIKYSINDNLWRNESLLDLSALKVSREIGEAPTVTVESEDEEDDGEEAGIEAIDPDMHSLWQLSPEEIEATRRMVEEENNRTYDQDVFDVFLLILDEQRSREDFASILNVIIECFKRTLTRCEFTLIDRFLCNINKIYERFRKDNHWALPLLDDFLLMVSSPRILGPLPDCFENINSRDAGIFDDLESMLKQLSPESLLSLGPMVLEVSDSTLRKHLNRVIKHLASRDPRPLYQLAKSSTPAVARQAIITLSRLGKTDHVPILMECANSNDVLLRRVAVKALTMIDPPLFKKIVPFVLDEDDVIRKTAYHCIVLKGNPDAEALLIDCIRTGRFSPEQRTSVILLYKALGCIGSEGSFDFLKKQLFGNPWWIGKMRSIHRQGALAAFMQRQEVEAAMQRQRAEKSLWPPIRRAGLNLLSFDSHE